MDVRCTSFLFSAKKIANHNKDEKSNLCVRDCITPEYCSTMKLYCVPSLHTAVHTHISFNVYIVEEKIEYKK